MKAKLVRCRFCKDWFSPLRSHCPNCGAAEVAKGVYMSVNNNGRLLPFGNGLEEMRAAEHVLELAGRMAK